MKAVLSYNDNRLETDIDNEDGVRLASDLFRNYIENAKTGSGSAVFSCRIRHDDSPEEFIRTYDESPDEFLSVCKENAR